MKAHISRCLNDPPPAHSADDLLHCTTVENRRKGRERKRERGVGEKERVRKREIAVP